MDWLLPNSKLEEVLELALQEVMQDFLDNDDRNTKLKYDHCDRHCTKINY